MSTSPTGYRARWVFPVDGEPLPDAVVWIKDGQVLQLDGDCDGPIVDLNEQLGEAGAAALTPALANAHTHLEFSQCDQPLGAPFEPLTDWIPEVLGWRNDHEAAPAIQAGLDESTRCGVGLIGEITTDEASESLYERATQCVVRFRELIAFSDADTENVLKAAEQYLQEADGEPRGLSPHSPYTTNPRLLEGAIELSRKYKAPLQMHLAESDEEMAFLRDHSGPFAALFERMELTDAPRYGAGTRTRWFLEQLAEADRVLVVHGNYLSEADWRFLAEHRDRMALVYCPRTHDYFGHPPYRLREMLRQGVRVVLGTDSRASNPDLSVMGELRRLADRRAAAPELLLPLATSEAAAALGFPDAGRLTPGSEANLALWAVDPAAKKPYDALFSAKTKAEGLLTSGSWAH